MLPDSQDLVIAIDYDHLVFFLVFIGMGVFFPPEIVLYAVLSLSEHELEHFKCLVC